MQPPPDIRVPSPRARWETIWHFALSVNGYEQYDGEVADLTDAIEAQWMRSEFLPGNLEELRFALFMQQRRYRWWGWNPTGRDAKFVRALVATIAEMGRGWVPGPHYLEDKEAESDAEMSGFLPVDRS